MSTHDLTHRSSRLRKALLILAAIVLGLFSAATAYTWLYSMGPVQTMDIPGSPAGPKVLVATQGSRFKDAVVQELLGHLRSRSARVRVIDVDQLAGVDEADWDALVLIHTWEMGKPPAAVTVFIERSQQRNKLVVLTTSGAGDFKTEGVDAITAASRMTDVQAQAVAITTRIDAILSTRANSTAP